MLILEWFKWVEKNLKEREQNVQQSDKQQRNPQKSMYTDEMIYK